MAKEDKRAKAEFGLGLGGLFKGMGDLFELISKMTEEGTQEIVRSGEIEGLPGKAKGVYGFTIKMGLGGQPTVERFGNIKKTEKGPVVAEVQEPMVDVFDEKDSVLVIAELPGVEEGDISLEIKGDVLSLTAAGKHRKYSKEVLLPAAVDAESKESTYRNGILEIKLAKKR